MDGSTPRAMTEWIEHEQAGGPSGFYTGLVARIYRHLRSAAPDPAPYARFIARSGAPALELGCGDGDPLLDLRAAGLDVDGLDASIEMLDRCRTRAAERGLDVVLHHATFESMDLGRRYRSIFLTGATFNLLPDDDAFARALGRIAAHLEPGGSALIPLFVPDPPPAGGVPAGGGTREVTDADGTVMRVGTVSMERDEMARRQVTVLRYELVDAAGSHVVERPWLLHWIDNDAFARLACDAGLDVARVFGPTGAPHTPNDTSVTFLLVRE